MLRRQQAMLAQPSKLELGNFLWLEMLQALPCLPMLVAALH
jgi:hypothetical protein